MTSIVTVNEWCDYDSQYFLTVGYNGKETGLYQSKVNSDKITKVASKSSMADINCIDYSRNKVGIVATSDVYTKIFNLSKPDLDPFQLQNSEPISSTNFVCFSDNDNLAVSFLGGSKTGYGFMFYDNPFIDISNHNTIDLEDQVNSMKFWSSPNHKDTLLIGTNNNLLKEYDPKSGKYSFKIQTSFTSEIQIGPFNKSHYFTSLNKDNSKLSIWDRRHMKSSMLTLSDIFFDNKLKHPCYRMSSNNYNELLTLYKPGLENSYIKKFNFDYIPNEINDIQTTKSNSNKYGGNERIANIDYNNIGELFVSKCKNHQQRGNIHYATSFDYCNDTNSSLYFGSLVVLTSSDKVFKVKLTDEESSTSFNNYNEIALTTKNYLEVIKSENRVSEEEGQDGLKAKLINTESEIIVNDNNFISIDEILSDDISQVMYKRALANYDLSNMKENSNLFSKFNKDYENTNSYLNSNYELLRICWKWLNFSNLNCNSGVTIQNGLNISFEGIYNIWDGIHEILEDENRRANINLNSKYNDLMSKKASDEFLSTIKKIIFKNKQENKTNSSMAVNINIKTEKIDQRRYCLLISGWYITQDQFNKKIETLKGLKYYDKAAALCVFMGDVKRAINILNDAPTSNNNFDFKIIATAILGFFKKDVGIIQDEDTTSWKYQCKELSRKLASPYLRAIFAYLHDKKWQDVLDEPSIALKDKLLIAFKYFNDEQLSQYLSFLTRTAVANGNPEGIMLTGLTRKGMTLLQNYNDRYSDVQTVALIGAFAVPRFFEDERVDRWISSYCDLLNSWKMFRSRAKFEINRRKLSRNDLYDKTLLYTPTSTSSSTNKKNSKESNYLKKGEIIGKARSLKFHQQFFLDKMEKQLLLKCISCDRDISHLLNKKKSSKRQQQPQPHDSDPSIMTTTSTSVQPKSLLTAAAEEANNNKKSKGNLLSNSDRGVVSCVCGASLPKCAICLYSLGAPIRYGKLRESQNYTTDFIGDWATFCLNCNHAMHSSHADEWFEDHTVCPVPECNCHCVLDVIE